MVYIFISDSKLNELFDKKLNELIDKKSNTDKSNYVPRSIKIDGPENDSGCSIKINRTDFWTPWQDVDDDPNDPDWFG